MHRPYGAGEHFGRQFPTLKRGANDRRTSGARKPNLFHRKICLSHLPARRSHGAIATNFALVF
jgi:hypothetical protein